MSGWCCVYYYNFRISLFHYIGKCLEYSYFLGARGTQIFLNIFHIFGRHLVFPGFCPYLVFISLQNFGFVNFANVDPCFYYKFIIQVIGRVCCCQMHFCAKCF